MTISNRLKRFRPLLMPLCYTLITLSVFWRLWTPIAGAERVWKYDPQHEYWGDMQFQADTLSEGEIAMWNPHDRGGFPVYGDPQPGMLYPANWPLVAAGSLTDRLPILMVILKILFHWVFGAIGMHLLMRRLGTSEQGAYVAGILFSFSSPKLRYGGSALNWSVAWLPWLLLALHRFAKAPTPRNAVFLGTSFAMILLTGAPAVMLYALILAVPIGLYLMWGRLRASWRPLGLAAVVAFFWVAPLVVSTIQQMPHSVRGIRNLNFVTGSVFTPAHFLSFLVPRLGHGENPYITVIGLFALVLAFWHKEHRRLAMLVFGIVIFAIAISLGSHAGFLASLASSFSPFSLFRHAHRYLYVSSLGIALLAGLGTDVLLRGHLDDRREEFVALFSKIATLLTFALGLIYLNSVASQDNMVAIKNQAFGLAFVSSLAAGILLLLVLKSRGTRRLRYAWVIPLVLFCDIWTGNHPHVEQRMEKAPNTKNDVTLKTLANLDQVRIYDDGYLQYRPGVRHKIRDFSGYEDDPLGLSRYTKFLGAAKRNLSLLGHANVRYFLDGNDKSKLRGTNKLGSLLAPNVWELHKFAPRVFYVPSPVSAKNVDEALAKLAKLEPGKQAVVEGKVANGDASLSPSIGKITHFSPNALRAEIETPGPGVVIISEAFYAPWQASLNGEECAVLPGNGMFRAISVPSAGKQVIEMHLRPKRFYGFLPLYFFAWLALLWAAFNWNFPRFLKAR